MLTPTLVTGAPGNVGTEVVRGLMQSNVPVRVAAFDVKAAQTAFGDGAQYVQFDFLRPETFAPAFEGVERMFLVRPPQLSNVEKEIAPAVRAAISAGVRQIVFLSLQGVEQNRVTPHYKIEQLLRSLPVQWTFLRASFFMQNLSTTHCAEIRDHDEIDVPVGHAKTSFIDARDIAASAVRVLTEDGHGNKAYTLTGGEALDYDEVAGLLSQVLKRSIRYTNPSVVGFIIRQLRSGRPFMFTLIMAALYTITRRGNAREVTGDVQQLLGREPIPFSRFASDFATVWQ